MKTIRHIANVAVAIFALVACLYPKAAFADPTTINIGTYDELYQAFVRVNDNPGEYIFNLTADVESSRDTDNKTRSVGTGSTVTIYGNGHTITGHYYGLIANGGTLNLGTEDGAHGALTLNLAPPDPDVVQYPMLYISQYSGGTINMYNGVTVTGVTNALGLSGTAVCVDSGTFNMYGGSITRCNNRYSGGAVALRGASAVFNMYGGEISNNKSTSTTNASRRAGAGVMIQNGTFNMQGGTISGNTASIGAGVYITPTGTFNISGGAVTGNVAEANGGGIYNAGGKLNISGTASIAGNTANSNSGYGGGIYAFGYSNAAGTVTISGGSITSNSAAYGAGIWNRTYSTVNMTGGTISQNSGGYGGGIGNVGTYNMSGGTITQNTASVDGGGVYTNMNAGGGTGGDGVFKMTGGALHNNTAVDGADIAAQVTDSNHLQLVDAAGMNATLSRSGQAITGWYEDGRYTSSGQKVSNSNWSNTAPTHYVDHSSDYNTTTDWYGALYLIAAHGPSDTATVTFKIVGGTWASGGTADKTVTLSSGSGMKLASAQIPTGTANTGYSSTGTWTVTATSGTAPTSATPNTTHTFAVGDNIVYTLTFIPNTHSVTYAYTGNVPSGVTPPAKKENVAYGTQVAAAPTPDAVTGYTFQGWDKPDAFAMPDEDVTITGTWKINQYTITFDTKGGTPIDPITQDYGSAVTAPADPTKDGYTFDGWDKPVPGTMPAENTTITAKWKPVEYTISYTLDGGTVDGTNPVKYTIESDTITLINPTREGYTFTGWTGTGLTDPATTVTIPKGSTGNRSYTAMWTPISYTIKFVDEDGTELQSGQVPYGGTPSYAGATPTKADDDQYTYAFAGWDKEIEPVTGDATYTATYTKTPKTSPSQHAVTFDSSGGTPVGPQTVRDGQPATKPADPTHEGYTFKGWTLDGEPYDFSKPVTGDITLVATWEKNADPSNPSGPSTPSDPTDPAGPATSANPTDSGTTPTTPSSAAPTSPAAPAAQPQTSAARPAGALPQLGDVALPVGALAALGSALLAGGTLDRRRRGIKPRHMR